MSTLSRTPQEVRALAFQHGMVAPVDLENPPNCSANGRHGPVLFLIYINSLIQLILNGTIVSFADDSTLIVEGDSWDETNEKAEEDMRVIER
ncbi:hypothetical protein HHI36_019842 [Cryptolaemus montrouzieri]|uniref:Reverse transcriptase domain-containing protein n=1 Tax=Cryptolaemus montrouzieri TaxID=559131 RepID=A0ABD2N8J4_9CUCU